MQLAMKPATIASEESNSEEDSEASGIETNDDSDDSNDKVYNEINTKNGKDESSNETVQGEESIDTLTDQDNIIGLQNGILMDDTPDITTKYASNYSKTVKNNYHAMAGIIHDNESLDGLDVNNSIGKDMDSIPYMPLIFKAFVTIITFIYISPLFLKLFLSFILSFVIFSSFFFILFRFIANERVKFSFVLVSQGSFKKRFFT